MLSISLCITTSFVLLKVWMHSMFSDVELMFNVTELKFNVVEHKFNAAKIQNYLGKSKKMNVFVAQTNAALCLGTAFFSWFIEFFEAPLHMRIVLNSLIFSTVMVQKFVDMIKKNALLCTYELFRLEFDV